VNEPAVLSVATTEESQKLRALLSTIRDSHNPEMPKKETNAMKQTLACFVI
jgi:hypothetical protein